ncbi:MAG: hypothetical protein AAFO17_09940 [Pseudomonadota bacterium]
MLLWKTAGTVEALISNQEALDAVKERIDVILMRAHALEDGRRVFKTEDGTQVFDQFGEEVGPEVIAPEDIDDSAPRWEDFKAEEDLILTPLLPTSKIIHSKRTRRFIAPFDL